MRPTRAGFVVFGDTRAELGAGFPVDPFQYYRHLRHTKRYVDDHLTDQIGLADVAREVGLSAAYYSAFFHKATGVRFSDWLSRRRISLAKQLLCERDRPIYQIATDVGFGSVSAFERMFKKHEHVSPSEYRRIRQDAVSKNLPTTS